MPDVLDIEQVIADLPQGPITLTRDTLADLLRGAYRCGVGDGKIVQIDDDYRRFDDLLSNARTQ